MFRAGAGVVALTLLSSLPAVSAGHACGPAIVQLAVLDQGGSALPGLLPSDFIVRIKNAKAAIKAVDYGVFPHTTVLLTSRTASMGQSIKLEMARQMAVTIAAGAPGTVLAGSFASQVSGLLNARDRQGSSASLQPASESQNDVFDAIIAGIDGPKLHRGDTLVLITDSTDSGSKALATDVQQRLASTGVRLFVIALPPAGNGTGSMQSLSDLADFSGGAMITPLRVDQTTAGVVIPPAQLEPAVSAMNRAYTQYSNLYQLETDLEGQDRPLPLRIEVERHKLGGGKVIAPASLAPCSAYAQ